MIAARYWSRGLRHSLKHMIRGLASPVAVAARLEAEAVRGWPVTARSAPWPVTSRNPGLADPTNG
jgi:hypothetical protein